MCMVPLHWITTVSGRLLSPVNGSVLWSASLSRTGLRDGSTSVVLFRYRLSKVCCNTNQSSDRFVSPVSHYLAEPGISLVLTSDLSDFPCCRHRMNLSLSGKRYSQIELHTQQIVILLVLNRAWSFGFMCVGSIVFGQFSHTSSFSCQALKVSRGFEPASAGFILYDYIHGSCHLSIRSRIGLTVSQSRKWMCSLQPRAVSNVSASFHVSV
jgi:hypothetical protein